MFCRFLKNNEVAFSSSLYPRNARAPEKQLLFWRNGQFCCQDYSYRNVISVLGKTIPFPHLQFYLIPGRKLLIFLSVHCKKAQQAPKPIHYWPIRYWRALISLKFIRSCLQSQGCYSAIDGTCRISSPALLVFVTKIHVRAFQQSIPCVNHLPMCHHSFLTCLFQSWKDDVWYL